MRKAEAGNSVPTNANEHVTQIEINGILISMIIRKVAFKIIIPRINLYIQNLRVPCLITAHLVHHPLKIPRPQLISLQKYLNFYKLDNLNELRFLYIFHWFSQISEIIFEICQSGGAPAGYTS